MNCCVRRRRFAVSDQKFLGVCLVIAALLLAVAIVLHAFVLKDGLGYLSR
jgi:hypothetical protein